jgi:hypothetical protein
MLQYDYIAALVRQIIRFKFESYAIVVREGGE